MQELIEIFTRAAFVIALIGASAGLILGIALFFCSKSVFRCNEILSIWVSTRQVSKPLSNTVKVEPFVYHHPVGIGIILLGFVAYMSYWFTYGIAKEQWINVFDLNDFNHQSVMLLLSFIAVFYAVMTVWALFMGVMLLVWPKGLRRMGNTLDKWYSTRGWGKYFEVPIRSPEYWILHHPRSAGVFIFIGSLFVLMTFLFRM